MHPRLCVLFFTSVKGLESNVQATSAVQQGGSRCLQAADMIFASAPAVCYKPTSRLAYFASLGIPLVTYPFASYIDILVEFGYPLVAETLEEVCREAVY